VFVVFKIYFVTSFCHNIKQTTLHLGIACYYSLEVRNALLKNRDPGTPAVQCCTICLTSSEVLGKILLGAVAIQYNRFLL
jgi:hypothetical protein